MEVKQTCGTYNLKYGKNAQINFELPSGALIAYSGIPNGEPVADPVAATSAVLQSPSGYPPLGDSTFAGDRVVLPVARDVPQTPALIAGLINTLVSAGVHPYDIRVLLAPNSKLGDKATAELDDEIQRHIVVEQHDPKDRDRLSFVAAAKDGKPIYVNRSLCDADLVIPVGCVRHADALGYLGVGTVFPTFADHDATRRFRAPAAWLSDRHRKTRAAEIAEATWLLGIRFTVQVIAADDGEIMHILAGDIDSIREASQERLQATWGTRFDRQADLVMVGMQGSGQLQSWNELAYALHSANQLVTEHGAIVICSEIRRRPGKAMRHLFESSDLDEADRRIMKERSGDAIAAKQIVNALRSNRVYLLSKLDNEIVEDLGIAPISDETEIENLCRREESCILVSNARYAFHKVH